MIDGVIQVKMVLHCSGSDDEGGTEVIAPPRDSQVDAPCVRIAIEINLDPIEFCHRVADDEDALVTPDLVLRVVERLPLPAADLIIQPPNGRTLVNFDTNFYTQQGEFTRTVRLLGQQVELRIWPERFAWRFGDGEVVETSSPGSPYPDLEITHSYRRKGTVSPSVDTTYAAQFRVGGGPWQDVAGTVTIAGSPQQLQVVTARPVLVGGRA